MTDRTLNYIIHMLLQTSTEDRNVSEGQWARTIDWAMCEWKIRHPHTRPPAYSDAGPTPECFTGTLPPIYVWPEEQKRLNASYRQIHGI